MHHSPFWVNVGIPKTSVVFVVIAVQLPLINVMFSIENTLILAAAVCGKSNYLMEIFHISDCFVLNANGDGGRLTLIEL